jgi:hypothetical protein
MLLPNLLLQHALPSPAGCMHACTPVPRSSPEIERRLVKLEVNAHVGARSGLRE